MKYPYAKHLFDRCEISAALDILSNKSIARGPTTTSFEKKFSEVLSHSYSTACSNGSAALEISLRAAGIGYGDEVIVPSITWVSTATSVSMVGAKPIFADISLDNYCIDYDSIISNISDRTKAIIPVHFGGIAVDLEPIWQLSTQYDLKIIEDCAHALGGKYIDGRPIGSSSNSYSATFSMHPAKNITCGEGGIITTHHPEIHELLNLYRSGGVRRNALAGIHKANYELLTVSSNFHLTDIQSAIAIVQLDKLNSFVQARRYQTSLYNKIFSETPAIKTHAHPSTSAFNLYIILVPHDKRDHLFNSLNKLSIGAYYHYPPLHKSILYNSNIILPNSEFYSRSALTLPLGPHLSELDIEYIASCVISILSA
ncbi:UDP-4-amino-4-deoxy-L-arabinose--oxoglutarate aminotransferase [Prochlorococcus marinus str. MIT 1342]|uniref:DegT/DnrJ/EryC1/StrS family aminotransferase n=1 Tax=Prochlorococcus TaxID=1218 RepID=UPI0007BAEFB2|nr:DegT/DnrJ/EryC1/StrS family aminotransferase [Prochlorococcus marinus]KZR79917.1 UDP-4-amino-4-deoxy-L-arabinose--oxoglutarate aminotransferase [Prochlorococcus marinus str. MIT 1342]